MKKHKTRRSGEGRTPLDWVVAVAMRALLGLILALPFERRVHATAALARGFGPLIGLSKRIRENLAFALPDLPPEEAARVERDTLDNFGRFFVEFWSGAEFRNRHRDLPLRGEGVATLVERHEKGLPIVFFTGHFGNFFAARSAMMGKGYEIGALYRPLNNAFLNGPYEEALNVLGGPNFSRGKDSYRNLLKFFHKGGKVCFLIDQHVASGADLTFFGKTAPTALSAAELALKYGAPLIPAYGVRRPDGINFDVVVEAPIPHTDPETMTQALNDSLERMTRANMGQWLWIHRRWKPGRER